MFKHWKVGIVIAEEEPHCEHSLPPDATIVEGYEITFKCQLRFAGTFPPQFTFFDSRMVTRPSETVNEHGLMIAQYILTAKPSDDGLFISNLVNFPDPLEPPVPEGGVAAKNSPSFRHNTSFPTMAVHCKYMDYSFLKLSLMV